MPHRIVGWFLALSAAWLADGVVSLLTRGPGAVHGVGGGVALGAPLYFAWLSVFGAVCAAALHGGAEVVVRRALRALGFDTESFASRALAGCLPALWIVGAYEAALYAATSFHNHELASLLLVVALALLALALLALAPAVAKAVAALTRDPAASVAVGAVFWALTLWAAFHVLWDNRIGFEQLSWGVRVSSVGFVLAAPPALWLSRRALANAAPLTVYGALACLAVASIVVSGEWRAYAAHAESENGAAGLTLVALRKTTDFDGDGASAWFGGGDCAPYDPRIHPMALEVIGDGIDNNCLGGDRTEPVTSPPPKWTGPLDPQGKTHNLVILTIDTVRPDHLPMFGYRRDTTPHLAKHAEKSVLFERTYTAAPLTRLAMSSFFSSQRASQVLWTGVERHTPLPRIDREQPWLPRLLQRKGFRTGAFVPRFSQFQRRGHGFDYGFTRYDYTAPMTHEGGSMQGFPAEKQIDKAIQWLDSQKSGRFFLWVHLVEPHFMYERHPSAPDYGDDPKDLYDSELWYADTEAGRLLEHLRLHGHFEDTVILVAGDHGESFLEHGKQYHGFELYEPGIRTLGMLSAPGLEPGRVKAPISLIDFTPTLLNLLDLNEDYDELRGQNLLPVIANEKKARPQVIVELFRLPLQGYEIAVVEDRYKLYYVASSGRVLMFDLQEDPSERSPLHVSHPEYARLLDHLTAVVESARERQHAEARKAEEAEKAEEKKRAQRAKEAKAKREAAAREAGANKAKDAGSEVDAGSTRRGAVPRRPAPPKPKAAKPTGGKPTPPAGTRGATPPPRPPAVRSLPKADRAPALRKPASSSP